MTKIKICGLSNKTHAIAACELGADFIGMVFFEKSPRHVSIKKAEGIRKIASEFRVPAVALTVNARAEQIAEIADNLQPDYFQFHGEESSDYIKKMKPLMKGAGVIQVVKIASAADVKNIAAAKKHADLVLVDSAPLPEDSHPGGNARAFDWNLLTQADLRNCLIAGGLTAENVAAAIATCNPWGIDVSSGVEKSYGVKCVRKIRKFIVQARKEESL